MPRISVFLYLCMCRYGYVKNGQKQSKTDKNEHENGKVLKAGAEEVKWSEKAQNVKESPKRFIKYQD